MEDLKNLHHWDVLAVSCIDGRFVKRTTDWVSEQTNGVFDFRTEVGSSRAIIYSVEDRERFYNIIDTSIQLHSIKEVWIIDHIDCGAYGGSKEHTDENAEKEFHAKRLDEAAKLVNVKYPELKVKKIYVTWSGVEIL